MMLMNLSVLMEKPTGISMYASQVLPFLKSLAPTLLISRPLPDYTCYQVPDNMTPNQGTAGHFRRLLWTQLKLPSIYQKLSADLLFSPLPEAPLYRGCRFVIMAHDLIPLRFPRPGSRLTAYFRYYIPQVLNQAIHIICNSQATATDLINFFQIPAAKITPIPLAYNAQQLKFLDLPTENYFLYLGRHDGYKNLQRLITAFAQVAQHSDVELWLAGPTDQTYTPQLRQQVQALGLEEQVKFLDYVPASDLPRLINQAIALVFPSLWEGFGFPVLEAMACGTPVMTSNVGSLPEVAGDGALLINPYEVGEMVQGMIELLRDPQLRQDLRRRGLAQAQQFSWEQTGRQTLQTLARFC